MSQYDGSVKFDTKIDTSAMNSALSKLKLTATAAFTAIGAAGTVAIKKCLDAGMSFESIMSQVEALSGATEKQMESLNAKAKEMGATTVFSASQAGEAMTYMAQAGWDASNMLSGLEGIIHLAASAGEDLALVSDIVTDSLTAFGLKASDSAHFSDVLAIASAASNTNVAMMGATFKYAAPLAGALGYSIEDVAVATGLMANAGIKGEQAGTALRSTFTRLADPPKEAAEALKTLGISIENTDGTAKPLSVTIGELRSAFANLTETEKTAYASQISGQMAMSGLLAIVNASETDFNNLTKAVENADGAAKNMAETMVNNLKGDLVLMQSALEGVEVAVYESLEEPFRVAVQGASDALSELERSISGGALQPKVEKLGNSLADFAGDCVDLASDALPGAIDMLSALVENLDLLTAAIIGVAQVKLLHNAMSTYQAMMKMSTARVTEYTAALAFEQSTEARGITISKMVLAEMTLKDLMVGVLTGKITLATAAQNLWNAAMNSNPIGLLITALGILIPLIGTGVKRAIDNANASTKAFNESMKEINDTYDRAIENSKEHITNAEVEAAKIDALTKKVFELDTELENSNKLLESNAEETENNKKKRAELLSAVEDLQELIPDLVIEIDKETGRLKTEHEEVEKLAQSYITLMRAKASANVYGANYEAALDALARIKKARDDAQATLETMPEGEYHEETHFLLTEGFYTVLRPDEEKKAYQNQERIIKGYDDEIAKAQEEVAYWENEANKANKAVFELEYASGTGTANDENTSTGGSSSGETDPEKELRDLRFAFQMGEQSAKDFYNALEAYRNKYFEEGSEDWQELTLEIKEGREELKKDSEALIEKELSDNDRRLRRREISEEEYYAEIARIRDTYYDETDDEYAELTDKIIEYNNEVADEAAETAKAAVKNTISEISSFADSALGEVESRIDSMQKKVASYGSLIAKDESGNVMLSDLHKQNEELFEYGQYLLIIKNRVKELGFNDETANGLFSSLSEMSVDDALATAKLLYDTSDFEFRKYIQDFERTQKLADTISNSFYKDEYQKEVDKTTEYMKEKFAELGVEVPEDFFTSGTDSAKNFGEAFLAEIELQMQAIQQRIAAFNTSLGLDFGSAVGGLFGLSGVPGNSTNNSYSNTFNIINPSGTVTSGIEAASTAAEVDRMRNG